MESDKKVATGTKPVEQIKPEHSKPRNPLPTPPAAPPPCEKKPERYYIRSSTTKNSQHINIGLKTLNTQKVLNHDALLDCGATELFINKRYVDQNDLVTRKLDRPVPVYNVDGTRNVGGSITEEIDMIMSYKGHKERATFAVCDLGKEDIVIGLSWLKHHNPEINWRTGAIEMTRCPRECGKEFHERRKEKVQQTKRYPEYVDEWKGKDDGEFYDRYTPGIDKGWQSRENIDVRNERIFVCTTKGSVYECSTADQRKKRDLLYVTKKNDKWEAYELDEKDFNDEVPDLVELNENEDSEEIRATAHHESWYNQEQAGKKADSVIPPQYQEYMDVFNKVQSERFPTSKKWDHEIKLKEGLCAVEVVAWVGFLGGESV
jgi:predicted aspartyl protease